LISARLSRIARAFYAAYETPLARQALAALDEQRWEDLVRLGADPKCYGDAETYYADACVSSFLKKFSGEIAGVDRVKTATAKWWDAEKLNYWSNQRLLPYVNYRYPGFRPGLDEKNVAIASFLEVVRKKVESWIGSAPSLVEGRFGPGATISDRGRLVTVPDKMTSIPTLTANSLWYLPQWGATTWARDALRNGRQPVLVRGNRFATVPKTALTDRCIGVEPSINVFFQLGLGRILRKRLRNATGWDLNTAQGIHRQVACRASATREFATLDLSNASDTVCRNLVRVLVPPSWVFQLEALRSPITEIRGKRVYLEKFSSMGNGFTFELETILFAAIVSSVLESTELGRGVLGEDLFVFGDDIICPDRAVRAVTAALNFCGFTVNETKSFAGSTPFRESCGGDYFEGRAVRPFYLKEEPLELTQKLSLVNGLSRAFRSPSPSWMAPGELRAWKRAVDIVPVEHRLAGPSWLGDTCINNDDEERWSVRTDRRGTRHIQVNVTQGGSLPWSHWSEEIALASLVYGVGDGKRGVIPRDPKLTYVCKWVPLIRSSWLPPLSKVGLRPEHYPLKALGPKRKVACRE
jgi:hypothetical protein